MPFNPCKVNWILEHDMVKYGRRHWQPTPVILPGKSHGQRSLVGCSPWGRWSWTWLRDFTFTFHFHALEKEMATHSSVLAWRIPGTGGTWWAAVYGVAQNWTGLKRLSSSSSSRWDQMPWSSFFECWILSQLFHSLSWKWKQFHQEAL